jgi:hypothetical protein
MMRAEYPSCLKGIHRSRRPVGATYSDVLFRVARGLVRLVEPLLIMAALFAAPIIAKEISRGRSITD